MLGALVWTAEVLVEPVAGGERWEFGGDRCADLVNGAGVLAFWSEAVLGVQRIDSMRWRMGARWGPRYWFGFAVGV
jgi:hypothetical protein